MISAVRAWLTQQGKEYRNGEADRPLAGYFVLMSAYAGATVTALVAARRSNRGIKDGISPWDLTQLTASTFEISRMIAKDPVTSPIRAPFTRYEGVSAPGELAEEVRGEGLRHSIGELLTCPMCLAQWVATALYTGLVFAPKTTRAVLATSTAVAGSDALQHVYVALQKSTS